LSIESFFNKLVRFAKWLSDLAIIGTSRIFISECLVAPNFNDTQHIYHHRVKVMYCINLNSSAAVNESMLRFSNLPLVVNDDSLDELLAAYGAVRSIQFQAKGFTRGEDGVSHRCY